MNNGYDRAKEAIEAIEAVLAELGVKYEKREDDVYSLVIYGEDLAMPINLWVEPEYSLVTIGSVLPFRVEKEKIEDMTFILNELNARIINGSFYLDRETRLVKFKIVDSYLGAPVAKEAIRFHLEILTATVDKYNDKLLDFNEGKLDRVFFTTCI